MKIEGWHYMNSVLISPYMTNAETIPTPPPWIDTQRAASSTVLLQSHEPKAWPVFRMQRTSSCETRDRTRKAPTSKHLKLTGLLFVKQLFLLRFTEETTAQ